jgi:hypothetical protein
VIRLKSVDLPAPFGPMMPKRLTLGHLEGDIVGHLQGSEALGHVLQGKHAHGSLQAAGKVGSRARQRAPFFRAARFGKAISSIVPPVGIDG